MLSRLEQIRDEVADQIARLRARLGRSGQDTSGEHPDLTSKIARLEDFLAALKGEIAARKKRIRMRERQKGSSGKEGKGGDQGSARKKKKSKEEEGLSL